MINNEKAVIFDLDGTLIDTMSSFSAMVIKKLKQRGIKNIKVLTKKLEDALSDDSQSIPSGPSITLIPKIFWKIGRNAGLTRYQALFFTIDCVTKARDIYNNAPLFSDVKDSLFRLKSAGYSLGIYTLASRRQLNMILTKHNIAHFFNPNSIISRNDVKKTKPDPEGVLLAFNGCSVIPHYGIYIGDMPSDIIAGNRAGAITIGVTTGLFNSQTLNQLCQPNIIFESLGEASNWILDSFLLKN
ncbi:MAG: HAD family hydrolase [Candidatus Hodarchaeota archaeon]